MILKNRKYYQDELLIQFDEESKIFNRAYVAQMENEFDPDENDLSKFRMASIYVKSSEGEKILLGIDYLLQLIRGNGRNDNSLNLSKRDCIFLMCCGFYKLKKYRECQQWLLALKKNELSNKQTDFLLKLAKMELGKQKWWKSLISNLSSKKRTLGFLAAGMLSFTCLFIYKSFKK